MAEKISLKDWDHPVLLLFFVTLGVVATTAVLSGIAQHFGWTGLLSLLKGGVAPTTSDENTH